MTLEEFPVHLKRELDSLSHEEEEEKRRREMERSMCKVRNSTVSSFSFLQHEVLFSSCFIRIGLLCIFRKNFLHPMSYFNLFEMRQSVTVQSAIYFT